jgi:hypothetical protein
MERMDMHSKNEYLKVIRERYFPARTRKEKTLLLDEYCGNTGQSRKYVIWKIHRGSIKPKQRKRRKEQYDGQVKAALVKDWEIFDYACGQRLKPLLKTEVERLRDDEVVNGVVLMGIHPTFRAHPQKTFRLLANAVYWTALQ